MVLGPLLSKHHTTAQYEEGPYLAYLATASAKKKLMAYAGHVVSQTIAFDDITDPRSKKDEARKKFNWFARRQKNSEVHKLSESYSHYFQIVSQTKHKEEMLKKDPANFQLLKTDPVAPLHILDCDGVLMGYRLRVPQKYLDQLNATDHLIPSKKKGQHARGNTINRHWTVWRKYKATPHYSADYLDDNALPERYADQWLQENSMLFEYMSKDILRSAIPSNHFCIDRLTNAGLRNLDPQMYSKYLSICREVENTSEGYRPLAGAWMGLAMNQDMTKGGTFHHDRNDNKFGMNAAIGWGDFQSMALAMPYLNIKVEMVPGDLFMFLGRNFIHGAVDVVGTRSMINVFVHDTMIVWGKERKNYPHGSIGPAKGNQPGRRRGMSPEPPNWRRSRKPRSSLVPKTGFTSKNGKQRASSDQEDPEEDSEPDNEETIVNNNESDDDTALDTEDEDTIHVETQKAYQGMQNNATGTMTDTDKEE